MQVLLISQNATIERLVKLSSGKLGYELTNAKDISEVENGAYNFVVVDSDLYNEEEFGILKQKFKNAKYILIIAKGAERPNDFDVYMEKPFLPTELVDIFGSLATSIENTAEEDAVFADKEPLENLPNEEALHGSDGQNDSEEKNDGIEELAPLNIDSKEEEPIKTAPKMEKTDDDFEINLDEQMSAIDDEVENIDFDMPENISLDEASDEVSMPEIATNDDEFATLDGPSIDEDDTLPTKEALTLEDKPEKEELNMDNETNSVDEELKEELHEERAVVGEDVRIFDEDEVDKLKNLLDETEEERQEGDDDISLDDIKIHNEELGSLTEESLAEALGVSINNQAQDSTDLDLEESGIDKGGIPDSLPTTPSPVEPKNFSLNALELNPNKSITISLDALKELLNMADITVNITLSKKQ